MKKSTAKVLSALVSELEAISARLDDAISEEQGSIDSKSEKWIGSDAGEAAVAQVECLTGALQYLYDATSELENVIAAA